LESSALDLGGGAYADGAQLLGGDDSQRWKTYMKKYASDLNSYSADPVYAVRPRVVFGLVESSDKIRGNPTRWNFSAQR